LSSGIAVVFLMIDKAGVTSDLLSVAGDKQPDAGSQ
jgi:hypothetical protein